MKLKLNDKGYYGKFIFKRDCSLVLQGSYELAFNLGLSQADGYRPAFMHEVIDFRTKAQKSSDLFNKRIITPSVKATGKTKQGKPVIVYAHLDNYLSNPENLRKINRYDEGSAIVPIKEFHKLLDLDEIKDENGDRLVWVIDYSKYSKFGFKIDNVFDNPEIIPFLCGEERAKKYVKKCKSLDIKLLNLGIGSEGEGVDEERKGLWEERYDYFEGNSVWRFLTIDRLSGYNLEQRTAEYLNAYTMMRHCESEYLAIREITKGNLEKRLNGKDKNKSI